MRSKTSCFNITLFRKNILRFWPIWSIYLLIMILMMPISLFNQAAIARIDLANSPDSFNGLYLLSNILNTKTAILPLAVFSILSAVAVFSYLYNTRSCYMMHALPLKRNELFLTNYLSGFLFLVCPQILTFLISMIMCIMQNITHVEYLLFWLLIMIGITFFTYTVSVFCCQLSGNLFAVVIFYVVINFAFQCARYFISVILSSVCFGLSASGDTFFYTNTGNKLSMLSPLYHLSQGLSLAGHYDANGNLDRIAFTGYQAIIIYCIVAIFLLIISVVFYRRRQSETAGDVIAVPWLVPVFRWLVSLFGGLCAGTIISESLNINKETYFTVLIIATSLFTLIFFYIAQMLLSKKFNVFKKKQIPEFIICIGIMVIFMSSIKADWFHIEDYVPDKSQISSISLTNHQDIISADEEAIDKLLNIHQSIVNHKEEYRKYDTDSSLWEYCYDPQSIFDEDIITQDLASMEKVSTLYFTYYMKDGSQILRTYTIPVNDTDFEDKDSAASLVADLQSNTDYYFEYLISSNFKDATIRDGSLTLLTSDYNEQTYNISQEDMQKIWEAFQKDAREGKVGISIKDEPITDDTAYYNTLSMFLYCEDGFHNVFEILPDNSKDDGIYDPLFREANIQEYMQPDYNISTTSTAYLPLNSTCTNTLEVIRELGILNDEARLVTNNEYYQYCDELE